jgi:SAM-dependent methyltransferase
MKSDEQHQIMETVTCNLCGSDRQVTAYEKPDTKYALGEWFRVVECANCGLGFVNPRPTFDEIWKYYPREFYEDFRSQHRHHLRRYATEAMYLAELESIRAPLLLDVGCANGDFPRYMQARGWRVEGVEASPAAEMISDFPVFQGWFPDMKVSEPRFDAVTAWAVLEHVHDPAAYFRKAAAVLRPGGLLVFLVTNFHSLASRRLFGEDIPRHLYFFTEATVERYLGQSGLSLERVDYSRSIYQLPPHNWLHYAISRLKGQPFTWPAPTTYGEFLRATRREHGWKAAIQYSARRPLSAIDRLLVPLVEQCEVWTRRYGIVVYVARRA